MITKDARLELGFVRTDPVKDEVLMEVLDHLGVIYKEANAGRFPCSIASTRGSSIRSTVSQKVLMTDEILPLDEVIHSLSGIRSMESRDSFELEINEFENKLLDALRNAFWEAGVPLVRKWFWPDFSKACCVLTHDVDFLAYSPFHMVILRKESPWKVFELIVRHLLKGEDYGYNIPEMLEIERSKGFGSTFFFRTDYGRMNEIARRAQVKVKGEGSEIGLHGSRGSHKDSGILRDELSRIEKISSSKVQGIRYHSLKFSPGLSWRIEDEIGFEYDASFANNRYFGFKSQLCYPYHPIDLERNTRLGVLEIPTAFMDWTALDRKYSEEDCKGMLTEVMDAAERHHGCFAVNFHNTYMNNETFPEIYETYLWLLREILARKYWTATAIECHDWWTIRANAHLSLRLRNGAIVGFSPLNNLPLVVDRSDGKADYRIVTGAFRIEV